MKKTLFVPALLSIMLLMNCEVALGSDDEDTPKNVFAGGTWERQLTNYDGEVFQIERLSFTSETLTVYYWYKNGSYINEHTYTATYELSFDKTYDTTNVMSLTSDEAGLNGQINYLYYETDTPYIPGTEPTYAGDVYFYSPSSNVKYIGGIYSKVK